MSRKRKPIALSDLIDGVVDRLGVSGRLNEARVEAAWRELAGPQIARVTRRVRVQGDRLLVQITSAEWRSELHMQRLAWCDRLNEVVGGGIKEIVFR